MLVYELSFIISKYHRPVSLLCKLCFLLCKLFMFRQPVIWEYQEAIKILLVNRSSVINFFICSKLCTLSLFTDKYFSGEVLMSFVKYLFLHLRQMQQFGFSCCQTHNENIGSCRSPLKLNQFSRLINQCQRCI